MLIQTAVRIYDSQGFHRAGERAISREAGLTECNCYENLADGDALPLADFGQVIAAVPAQIIAADDPTLSAKERTRRMLGV